MISIFNHKIYLEFPKTLYLVSIYYEAQIDTVPIQMSKKYIVSKENEKYNKTPYIIETINNEM